MYGLPQFELSDQEEQKKYPKAFRTPKILQVLQEENLT